MKFIPISPDRGEYANAMTIMDIITNAAGQAISPTTVNATTLALTGAFTGTTIAGTTIAGTRLALTSGFAQWGMASQAAQYTASAISTGVVLGNGSSLDVKTTFTGNSSTTAYTISDIVSALKQCGILAL